MAARSSSGRTGSIGSPRRCCSWQVRARARRQPGHHHRLVDRHADVGDAELQRLEMRRRADVPVDLRRVLDAPGRDEGARSARRTRPARRRGGACRSSGTAGRARSGSWRSPCPSPSQKGELAVRASIGASQGRARFITWIAASRSAIPTWTWQPKMICSRASCWKSAAIPSSAAWGSATGLPSARTGASRPRRSGCRRARPPRSPPGGAGPARALASARVRQTGVPISICDRYSSFVTSSPTASCALGRIAPRAGEARASSGRRSGILPRRRS